MLLVRWGRLGRIIFLEAPVACDLKAFPRSRGLDPQRGTLETVVVQFPESTNESGRGDGAAEASSCLGPSGPSVSSSGSEFPKHRPPQLLAQLPGVTCTGRTPSRGLHAASSSHILVVSGRGCGRDRPLAPNGQLGVPWGRRPGLGLPSSS